MKSFKFLVIALFCLQVQSVLQKLSYSRSKNVLGNSIEGYNYQSLESYLKSLIPEDVAVDTAVDVPEKNLGQQIQYDMYILATSWPNSACAVKTCYSNLKLAPATFNLHGLWPQEYAAYSNIHDCTAPTFNYNSKSSSLQSLMGMYWNSLYGNPTFLVTHEYNKHGTCMNYKLADSNKVNTKVRTQHQAGLQSQTSGSSSAQEDAYINMAISLSKMYNVYDMLAKEGILPSDSAISSQKVADSIKKQFGVNNIHLLCKTDGHGRSLLSEVRICVDVFYNPRDCYDSKLYCSMDIYYLK